MTGRIRLARRLAARHARIYLRIAIQKGDYIIQGLFYDAVSIVHRGRLYSFNFLSNLLTIFTGHTLVLLTFLASIALRIAASTLPWLALRLGVPR